LEKDDLLRSLSIDRGSPVSQGRRGPGWPAVIGVAVVVAVGAAGGVWLLKPAPPAAPAPDKSDAAASSPATVSQVQAKGGLIASGFVVAHRRATVAAEVTGRVLEIRVEEGQTVHKGEVLAVLDSSAAQADLNAAVTRVDVASATIHANQADLTDAQAQLDRTRALAKSGYATDASLKTAIARVESLTAQHVQAVASEAAARRDAERLRVQLSKYVIYAPFDAVVIDRAAQAGEIISPISAGGGFTRTGLCSLVDMNSLEVEVEVNEAYISRVAPGQKVDAVLDAYPDLTIPGSVIAIIPTANRDKATVRVRVRLDTKDSRILPDMAVKVAFKEAAAK
jgi:RND family efflux transporter MFP subunit